MKHLKSVRTYPNKGRSVFLPATARRLLSDPAR